MTEQAKKPTEPTKTAPLPQNPKGSVSSVLGRFVITPNRNTQSDSTPKRSGVPGLIR